MGTFFKWPYQGVTIGYNEVVGHTKEKKKEKTSIFDFHETTPKDLIFYLKPQFEKNLLHNILARCAIQGVNRDYAWMMCHFMR